MAAPLPDLVLYGRAGCHLCDEARAAIGLILDDRRRRGLPVPALVETDIESDPDLHRRWLAVIPVVEFAGDRVELATSVMKLQRLITIGIERAGVA